LGDNYKELLYKRMMMTTERRSRGNKRSRAQMLKIERKIRDLMYSENPRYTDEQILGIIQIPKRTYDRYKSKIWREDEPKRERERLEAMKAEIGDLCSLENMLKFYKPRKYRKVSHNAKYCHKTEHEI
jgi:hypothetical protein